ncbi:hypothetical protein [Catellatospora sp. NPDC049609]|uniref:COG1361 S-layer family protein n=1 Tax=Catellatospora sp. NPDC049609 TaxID=3155505 RepID=UPI00344ADC6F
MSRRLLAAHGVLAVTSALAVGAAPQWAAAAPKPSAAAMAAVRAQALQPDLSIFKEDDPDPVTAGQLLTYTLTVSNTLGTEPAASLTVVDTLPAGLVVVATYPPSGSCSVTTDEPTAVSTVTCELADLPVGQSFPVVIQARVPADQEPGLIVNRATVTLNGDVADPNLANNTVEITTAVQASADLSVTKLCKPDEPATAGGTGYCDIIVDNLGPSDAADVELTDYLTAADPFDVDSVVVDPTGDGIACAPSELADVETATIVCTLGDIAAGGRSRVRVTVDADEDTQINDVATVRSATPDPDTGNNKATGRVDFVGSADLVLTKTGPETAVAGGPIQYVLTVDNEGPSTARAVTLRDTIPAGVTVESVTTTQGTCANNQPPGRDLVCGLGNIAPADPVVTVTINGTLDADLADGTVLSNGAVVSSETATPDNSDNQATVFTTVESAAELTVTKLDAPDPVLAGNNLTYTITATNGGPSDAQLVTLTDTLPEGTTFVADDSDDVCDETAPGTVLCALGTVAAGASESVTLTVRVDPSVADGTELLNTVVVASETTDTDPDNNTATATTVVDTSADLWIDKTAVAFAYSEEAAEGDKKDKREQTAVFTLTVHNDEGCEGDARGDQRNCGLGGPSDAQDVVVTDQLPLTAQNLQVLFTSPECTYTAATHTVTCNLETLAAGATAQFVIKAKIKGNGGGAATEILRPISNTATVSSSTPDPNLANNTNTAVLVGKGRE